ncbi:myelin-associated glycoprotein-like isoform X2 [Conger conger]|uniref:myelin-associated glycoprotein-like isoform X2 n=1 Tax=Conger conger TaxID=82655 RepID=UPI002A5A21A7|nr:myelin-associated glycoprotein-like isoform X2 [Conger conger]
MTEVERLILIGCLLQGALGREWAVWMPQSIEALSGSCVLIPCRFKIPSPKNKYLAEARGQWKIGGNNGRVVFDSNKAEKQPKQNEIKGTFIGKLTMNNCTTILDQFPSSPTYRNKYFFRLESQRPIKFNFPTGIQINAQVSPPKPKLTPEKVEVMEGTSVSLSCSAAAPCPKLPPNLTWTPTLSDSVDQLQENEDNTTFVSSVLTFTASHLHHGQKITCRALYTLQQGGNLTSEASLTLRVLYMPQISGSGSCSRTAAEISCSCESRGNPSPSMEWRVSGLRVTNSTDRVIREEQLGNTGLRSSLTMRHSQGDTATLLCLSTNALGTSSLQLHAPSPDSGFNITALLISAAAVVGAIVTIFLIMKTIQKQGWAIPFLQGWKKRDSESTETRRKDTVGSPSPAEEDPVYPNHAMATTQPRDLQLGGTDPQPLAEDRNKAELESMHYSSIKHSPRSVETQGQDAREGAAGHGDDVVYSQVALKKIMEVNPELCL